MQFRRLNQRLVIISEKWTPHSGNAPHGSSAYTTECGDKCGFEQSTSPQYSENVRPIRGLWKSENTQQYGDARPHIKQLHEMAAAHQVILLKRPCASSLPCETIAKMPPEDTEGALVNSNYIRGTEMSNTFIYLASLVLLSSEKELIQQCLSLSLSFVQQMQRVPTTHIFIVSFSYRKAVCNCTLDTLPLGSKLLYSPA